MKDKIANLVTESGVVLRIEKRTAAVMAEVFNRQQQIETCQAGQIEIIIDFKNSSVRVSVREIAEARRIE
jgi:hypothetical protein